MFGLGVVLDASATPAALVELEAVFAAVGPHRVGDYPNVVEQAVEASTHFDSETWDRLRRVKAPDDAKDVLKGNHHIPDRT